MKAVIYTFSLLLLFVSCKSVEQVKSEGNINNKRYAIGKGGGFTGDYTEYILNEDGKVYKYDFKYDREVFTKQLEESDLLYFLDKIENLGLEGVEINKPGNISYYIDVRIGKSSINKIIWGDNKYYPPYDITTLYKELFAKLTEQE